MKKMKIRIVTVLLVVVAALSAGCTDILLSASPVTPPQITETAVPYPQQITTTVTVPQQPVITVQVTATERPIRIFTGEFHWVEYRENNSVTMPPNSRSSWIYYHRLERSTGIYKGSPAIHDTVTTVSDFPEYCINETVTITRNGSVFIADTYLDASTGRYLGGTLKTSIKGVAQPPDEYPADDSGSTSQTGTGIGGWMGFTPFDELNIPLTGQGTESITVPAGVYPYTQKYTGKFDDGTPITIWVAPGVPVPVRYEFPNKYLDGKDPFEVFELTGWG